MVELKVRKFGNSLGVILPKEVLQRLGAVDGDPLLLIELSKGNYKLIAFDPKFAEKMSKAEKIMGRYRNTLRALSE